MNCLTLNVSEDFKSILVLTAFKCQKEYHYLAMLGYEKSTSKKHLLLMTLHPPCLKPRQTSTQIVSLDLAVCKLNG